MHYTDELLRFVPLNDQERNDKTAMLSTVSKDPEGILLRDNLLMHMTASSIIVNKEKTKTLMAYHNIYNSWAWTGGHADGETDLLSVALREAAYKRSRRLGMHLCRLKSYMCFLI